MSTSEGEFSLTMLVRSTIVVVGCVVQVVRGQNRVRLVIVGTLRRYLPSGRSGAVTDGPFRRQHGLWDVLSLAHGCKFSPFGTLCDTMRWVCLVICGQTALVCPRSGRFWRHHPSGWVCARSCVGLFALRNTSFCFWEVLGDGLLAFRTPVRLGLNRLSIVVGSDLGGTAFHLAHRNVGGHLGRSPQTSHNAQRHTMPGKTTEWFIRMGRVTRC